MLWGYSPAIDDELRATYSYLLQQNVNWFDTADSYGTGKLNARSESLLGQFHNLENKKKVYYCTKLAPFPWIIGKDSMKRRILASQERLQRPQIDMIQLHWPPSLRWQEKAYIEAFSEVVKEGKATQVGLSNYGPKQLQRITQQFNQKDIGIYSNQVQFSLLSRLPLQSGLTDVCAELKIQPIAYSPLALGLLTDKYSLDK